MASLEQSVDKPAGRGKLFHAPVRLRIMSALMVRKTIHFTQLARMLDLTRGNLSMHMKLLVEKKYVSVVKAFVNNRPRTTYSITTLGQKDFSAYVKMLESIISGISKE